MILPIAFLTIGLGFIIGVLIGVWKKSNIRKRGNRYPAKIYGYVQNTSYLVNDAYHKYMQEGAKYVIVAIWNLYDLVYRKVFNIWVRASWGIFKLLCTVVLFPVILILMVVGGLMYIAFPVILIGGVIALLVSRS